MNSENIENNNIQKPLSPFEIMEKNDLNSYSMKDKFKNFIYTKRIYFIIFLILLLLIIIIILISTGGNNNKDSESSSKKEQKEEEIYEPFSKYYSQKTKNYIDFIIYLEKNNSIAYHYNFQNNSKGSFKNKYQYLYEKDTSLISNNSEVGNYLFYEESYLTIETDETNYYKNILKKNSPKHYIYGPSYIKEEYNEGQKLYNPNIKINDTKDWEGITLSLNFKQSPFAGNSNGGKIFGWGSADYAKPGFFISLSYGIVYFKQGIINVRYDYEDSVKIGYNESIPEKRYLTFRPFRDERWHQIIISMRKIKKEEEKYLSELSLKRS